MRTGDIREPFPEEIIRLIAMRFSDILFAPSQSAYENLRQMGYIDKTVRITKNTGLDAVRYALQSVNGRHRPQEPYVIATTHRVETIYSRSRLAVVVDLLQRIAQERRVFFVLHEPTLQQLRRFNLYDQLAQNKAIETLPLQSYLTFVDLIAGADFVVTDGGSIQEECYFLNVPCLIMRSRTEHVETLGKNGFLASFDPAKIEEFFEMLPSLRQKNVNDDDYPSQVVVEHVLEYAKERHLAAHGK